ncbi:MAG: hypothetical protein K2G31_00160 [Clostridia bacterium]|nr:hypothetical protein [Clostridia bacterium]
MKGTFRKSISALLLIIMLVLCATMLFACDKNNGKDAERDRQARAESVATIKDAFLSGMNGEWKGELDDEAVASLDNAGEYIVAAGWTQLVCDVLSESSLQTAKLQSLATNMSSDDGKALIKDFSENAEFLVTLVKQVSFTPQDISNLVYELIYALVDRSSSTISSISTRLNKIRTMTGISVATRENLSAYMVNLSMTKSTLVPTASEKQNMLKAFEEAKAPLSELIEFAYNSSISAVSDNLFGAIFEGGGALQEINNSEIVTLVNTVLTNVTSLKDALNNDSLAKLNNALNLVIKKFDTNAIYSAVYGQIVKYAKYAYMVVDVIPIVCDVVNAGGTALTNDETITQLKNAMANDEKLGEGAHGINVTIMTAKVVLEVMKKFDEKELCSIMDEIVKGSAGDFQKAIPILALDVMLNISALYDSMFGESVSAAHPEVITTETLKTIVATIISLNSNLDSFKQKSYAYTAGKATFEQVKSGADACSFGSYGIEKPNSVAYNERDKEKVKVWYEYYMSEGLTKINEVVAECSASALTDIKLFIKEFYQDETDSSESIKTIAGWQMLTESITDEELMVRFETINKGAIMGLVAVVYLIFG